MKRSVLLLLVLLFNACGLRNPVRHTLTIEPDSAAKFVTVTVRTDIADVYEQAERQRVDELRTQITEGRDPWTVRFAAMKAESEHVSFDRVRGALSRAEHSAKIPIDDLQRFMSDNGTAQITDGERWTELAFYPSTSARATRQQREHVMSSMHTWAADAARYLRALDALYSYLNTNPHRAKAVFTILLTAGDQKSTIEEEDALITPVNEALTTMVDNIEAAKQNGVRLDEEVDLVFNPLPAEIVVHLPTAIVASEGFEKRDGQTVAIPRRGLLDAISSLEGKWASPDPFAIISRASDANTDPPKGEEVAALERHSSSTVTAAEIEKELIARLRPAAEYRVRW